MIKIEAWFDGSCANGRNIEKPYGYGIYIFVSEGEDIIISEFPKDNLGTSNVAEWHGCLRTLEEVSKLVKKHKNYKIDIYSDSQLVVKQLTGIYACRTERLIPFYNKSVKLFSKLNKNKTNVHWIRRNFNKQADYLAGLAYKEAKQFHNL